MVDVTGIRELLSRGQKREAWNALNVILTREPQNEQAWLLALSIVRPSQRQKLYKKARIHVPDSQLIRNYQNKFINNKGFYKRRESNSERQNTAKLESLFGPFVIAGIALITIVFLVALIIGGLPASNKDEGFLQPTSTPDPYLLVVVDKVKNYKAYYETIADSIEIARILSYRNGDLTEDHWSVRYGGDGFYFVKFYFFYDGKHQYAEWRYDAELDIVKPTNDWGWTFFN